MKSTKREWLIKKRLNRNMRRDDIADLVGITLTYYGLIENNKKRPSPEIAQKIAKVLNFDWTLFYEKKKTIKTE